MFLVFFNAYLTYFSRMDVSWWAQDIHIVYRRHRRSSPAHSNFILNLHRSCLNLKKRKKSSKNKPVVIKMQKVEGIYYLGWSLNRAHSINKNIKLLGEKRYTQKTMGNLKAALTFTSKHLHIPLKRKESNLLIVSYILGISTTRSCSLLVS